MGCLLIISTETRLQCHKRLSFSLERLLQLGKHRLCVPLNNETSIVDLSAIHCEDQRTRNLSFRATFTGCLHKLHVIIFC